MTRTPPHSFCWAFCLSFACMFSWFVPVEALFAAPVPLTSDGDGPVLAVQQDHAAIPKQLRRDHLMVFGESVEAGPWAKKSAAEWDGLAPHIFVSLEGPCIYTPVTEIDITKDVLASAPKRITTRFISTTGWLTGPQGTFPTRFAVCSDQGHSLFFFTGMAPAQLLMDTFDDVGGASDATAELIQCDAGVAALDACDARLDSVLSDEGTPSAELLRTALAKNQEAVRDCWKLYAQAVQSATGNRELAVQSAVQAREFGLAIAQASALVCYAAAEAALVLCMASAMGWSFFGLAIITVAQVLTCTLTASAGAAACALGLSLATTGITGTCDAAIDTANAAYQLAMDTAKAALDHCLEVAKRKSSKTACAVLPELSPDAREGMEEHRDCYRATTSEHLDCLAASGEIGGTDHGFHEALDLCGSDH